MTTPRGYFQSFVIEGGLDPFQIFCIEQEIVLIGQDSDVGIGSKSVPIILQIPRLLQGFRHQAGQSFALIIGNDKQPEIILVGVSLNLLVQSSASERTEGLMQHSLIAAALTAVKDVTQFESKGQTDEEPGFDNKPTFTPLFRTLFLVGHGFPR